MSQQNFGYFNNIFADSTDRKLVFVILIHILYSIELFYLFFKFYIDCYKDIKNINILYISKIWCGYCKFVV